MKFNCEIYLPTEDVDKIPPNFVDLARGVGSVLQLPEINSSIDPEHIAETPKRVAKAYAEFFSGCYEDPVAVLQKGFKEVKYDEMVYVNNIKFVSFCAHHWLPFFGQINFAYLPADRIVGLSKIPRFIHIYAHRPQVQEKLAAEIADTFQEIVKPIGCGVVIEAYHLCMMIRGVKQDDAYTRTTALRGVFKDNNIVRQEFLDGVNHKNGSKLWP